MPLWFNGQYRQIPRFKEISCLDPVALIEALLRVSERVLGNDAAGITATEGVSVTSKLTRLRKVKNAGMIGEAWGNSWGSRDRYASGHLAPFFMIFSRYKCKYLLSSRGSFT